MPDLELCYLSAAEALARFRARTLSPVELRGVLIKRAETVEPTVNALSHRHFDEAMAKAREAEARYQRPSKRLRPLDHATVRERVSLPVAPPGVQIALRSYDDRAVFRVAGALERGMPLYADARTRPTIALPCDPGTVER